MARSPKWPALEYSEETESLIRPQPLGNGLEATGPVALEGPGRTSTSGFQARDPLWPTLGPGDPSPGAVRPMNGPDDPRRRRSGPRLGQRRPRLDESGTAWAEGPSLGYPSRGMGWHGPPLGPSEIRVGAAAISMGAHGGLAVPVLLTAAVVASDANGVIRDHPVAVSPAWIAGPDAPAGRLRVGGVIVVLIVANPEAATAGGTAVRGQGGHHGDEQGRQEERQSQGIQESGEALTHGSLLFEQHTIKITCVSPINHGAARLV